MLVVARQVYLEFMDQLKRPCVLLIGPQNASMEESTQISTTIENTVKTGLMKKLNLWKRRIWEN